MTNEINFFTEMEYNVELSLDNNNIFGKLIFSKESPAYLEIIVNDMRLALENHCPDTIECSSSNYTFKLMGCKKIGTSICPKFIIVDPPKDINEFSKIEISISELNIVLHDGFFGNKVENGLFISEINKSNFNSIITHDDNIKNISDHWSYQTNISHEDDVITKLTQRHIISVEAKRPLNHSVIVQECRHLCLLFSILTLLPTHINYAWVVHDECRYPIYFPMRKHKDKKKLEWFYSLITLKDITTEMWDLILNNSYKDKNFSKNWSRFYGMLSYDGYWEYEFLGFMSILDYYLSSKYTNKQKKGLGFADKYKLQRSELPINIINFIALSEDSFKRLLQIRNGVAHCDPDKLDILEDISKLSILKNRLVIHLHYLAMRDLGIEDNVYAISAIRSFNPVLMNSLTKRKWLNKIINDTPIVILRNNNFELLKSKETRITDAIFINTNDGYYKYHDDLTNLLRQNMADAYRDNNVCSYIDNVLVNNFNENYKTKYIGRLHIHTDNEDNFIEMSSAYILEDQ